MPDNNACYQVNISTRTVLKIIFIILALVFVYLVKEVLAIVFVAWVLASAIDPLVDRMQRYKIPRGLAIFLFYLIILLIIILAFTLILPTLTQEMSNLTKEFPKNYQALMDVFNSFKLSGEEYGFANYIEKGFENIGNTLTDFTSKLYNAATGFLGALIALFAILFITYYMTTQEAGIKRTIQSIAPANYQPYIIKKLNQIQVKLGHWLWGQLIVMFFVGILTGIALWIIGVPYVLLLALFAGLCQFIPIIGPIISAIPAVLFSFLDFGESPAKPLLVIIVFIVIQQIENQILTPKVMSKAVGLNPIVVIVTILIGAQLGGIVGIVIAVPVATIISIFLEDFFNTKKQEANKLEGEEYIKKEIKK